MLYNSLYKYKMAVYARRLFGPRKRKYKMLAAVRNFVIAFLIAAVVFGLIAWFITGFIAENVIGIADTPVDTGGETSAAETTDPEDQPNMPQPPSRPDLEGDSFNILLIGTDYRPDDFIDYLENLKNGTFSNATLGMLQKPVRTQNADLMLLVTVNETQRKITFSLIPPNTRVTVNGSYRLLNTCYDRGGVDEIVDFANYLTAVPIDYYIKVNVTDAGTLLDMIGGVTLDIPTEIMNPYYNPDRTPENAPYSGITGDRDFETVVAIEPGEQLIDSTNLFALLHYRTAGASVGERMNLLLALARAVLEKSVSPEYIGRAAEIFSSAIRYTESNMTVADMTANLGLFTHFDEFELLTLSYPGTYSTLGSEECFIPNLTDAYTLYRTQR